LHQNKAENANAASCVLFVISSKNKHDLTVFLLQLGATQGFTGLICVGMSWVLGRL